MDFASMIRGERIPLQECVLFVKAKAFSKSKLHANKVGNGSTESDGVLTK
jgi:hypothetical protein